MNYYDSILPASWLMDLFYLYLFANTSLVFVFVVRLFIRTLDRFRYRRSFEDRLEEKLNDMAFRIEEAEQFFFKGKSKKRKHDGY